MRLFSLINFLSYHLFLFHTKFIWFKNVTENRLPCLCIEFEKGNLIYVCKFMKMKIIFQ